jgi:hypothetical protein
MGGSCSRIIGLNHWSVAMRNINKNKTILDLCGGTGSWSKPYSEAGYNVINITLPYSDVRLFEAPTYPIYGILAAPPCDHFSVSGAQYWPYKDNDGRTLEAISVMDACMRIIFICMPRFWALENPVGRMKKYLGNPKLIFNPCDYGDPYTKKTLLWGEFNEPEKNPVEPVRVCSQGSWIQKLGGKSDKTKMLRGITPPGFSKAFFEANQ